jgi:hemerythrin-like domain-containing protein
MISAASETAMLRDKTLIPLSHQHQHALALCVRLDRALKRKLGEKARAHWQKEIARIFDAEIHCHFVAEESFLFPKALAYEPLAPLVRELLVEHKVLLLFAENAAECLLDDNGLRGFAETLARHVRREERELFETCQKLIPQSDLVRIAAQMDEYFRAHNVLLDACALPPAQPD